MSDGDKLPAGWVLAPLSDLLTGIEAGKSFKCEERPPVGNEVGVVKVSAVTWGEYREQESKTCTDSDRVNAGLFVRAGDFLFSRANTVELVGACVIARQVTLRVMLSDKILRFHFVADVMKEWVLHLLQSKGGREQIELLASGNQESMRNIGQERIGQIMVPLPPDGERTRIIAKLDELLSELEAGVAELRAAQSKLTQYRQSLLKAAVEGDLTAEWRASNPPQETGAELLARILRERRARWEARQLEKATKAGKSLAKDWQSSYEEPLSAEPLFGFDLPTTWAWATMDQVTSSQRYGTSAKTSDESGGVPVLRMGNIQAGALEFDNLKFLPVNHSEFPALFLRDGELLFNRTNSPELVGKTAVFRSERTPCSFASYLIGVCFVDDYKPEFASAFINSLHGRSWVALVVTQQVGQANVNGSKLAALAVPLPPLDEQRVILEVFEEQSSALAAQEAAVEHGLRMAAAQRQNILRAAFSGQLVPQDPNDEPASVLLVRIRAEREAAAQQSAARRGRKAKIAA